MEKIKVLHVGCGGMSWAWLKPLEGRDNVEVVALVDLNLETAKERAKEFKLEGIYVGTDLEEALEATKPDVVFDCTIPEAHEPVTLAALEAGCHVLGEKPLAHSMEAAHKLLAKASEADRIFAVTQNRRYTRTARRTRALIEEGVIGKVHTIYADFFIGAHFGGFRDVMDHVLLLDMSIHHFDLLRMLSGGLKANSVYCNEFNPASSWYQHGACADALFVMEGDLRFNYRGSWCAEGQNTSWNAAWRIYGEKGCISWDGDDELSLERVTGDQGFVRQLESTNYEVKHPQDYEDGHDAVITEFLDAVQKGTEPETIATDNIHSLAMVFATIESANSGQLVKL
ncbi:Gfo/Idh/MocA family oxidoreductase [Rubellicoccus peritrichatus]|uniref:Gfo/Idh/MocA family oxidoreductase n=1 Tax=Rubellicoccus peritrichatus TaxID=3080537 RepID=A0AAQ3QQ63_9BACT|nr:Gfo/Idh/MocA family oxidoreductase [Puniceicoccus sp. CR14]WOO39893.1 Gfo/Idh/MocA family oxidoreductase [Puniceicoccus sp. CR14]